MAPPSLVPTTGVAPLPLPLPLLPPPPPPSRVGEEDPATATMPSRRSVVYSRSFAAEFAVLFAMDAARMG